MQGLTWLGFQSLSWFAEAFRDVFNANRASPALFFFVKFTQTPEILTQSNHVSLTLIVGAWKRIQATYHHHQHQSQHAFHRRRESESYNRHHLKQLRFKKKTPFCFLGLGRKERQGFCRDSRVVNGDTQLLVFHSGPHHCNTLSPGLTSFFFIIIIQYSQSMPLANLLLSSFTHLMTTSITREKENKKDNFDLSMCGTTH